MPARSARILPLLVPAILLAGCKQPVPPPGGVAKAPRAEIRPAPAPPVRPPQMRWGCAVLGAKGLLFIGEGGTEDPGIPVGDPEAIGVSVSPDGAKLAWAVAGKELTVLNLTTGKTAKVPLDAGGRDLWAGSMAWSADSRRLAFTDGSRLRLVGPEGKATTLTKVQHVNGICFSPDGKQLAYGQRDSADRDLGLWRLELPSGEPVRVVKSSGEVFAASDPAWSPDGEVIAFLHAYEGGALCFTSPSGEHSFADVASAWSPIYWLADSSAVVYDATGPEGPVEGLAWCAPGSEPRRLVRGLVLAYHMLPSGLLLTATGEGEGGDDGKGEPPAAITRVRVQTFSVVNGFAQETWVTHLDGAYAACAWRRDAKQIAVFTGSMEEPGPLYIGVPGKELKAVAEGVRHLYGWVELPARGDG